MRSEVLVSKLLFQMIGKNNGSLVISIWVSSLTDRGDTEGIASLRREYVAVCVQLRE